MALATMAAIYGALKTVLATVSGVDQSSTSEFLPPIQTANTALIITPFGKESRFGIESFADIAASWQAHRIRCEFWTKHTGSNSITMSRAWDIGSAAVTVLLANQTLGGVIDTIGFFDGDGGFDFDIDAVTDDEMIEIAGVPYLRTVVNVPLTDFA